MKIKCTDLLASSFTGTKSSLSSSRILSSFFFASDVGCLHIPLTNKSSPVWAQEEAQVSFRAVSTQICKVTCCGDAVWIKEQLKEASSSLISVINLMLKIQRVQCWMRLTLSMLPMIMLLENTAYTFICCVCNIKLYFIHEAWWCKSTSWTKGFA